MRKALIAAGAGMLAAGLAVPSEVIEQVCGRAPGSLSWGPSLLRLMLALLGAAGVAYGWRRRAASSSGAWDPNLPWLWLGAMSAAALGLRLIRLDTCLWLDEVFAVVESIRPPVGHILTSFPTQNQHMLYSLAAHAALRAFGESAWAVRLPAVLFGVVGIWALFLLGRKLAGRLVALLACALMTVSYHHVWFSQNARGYTGVLLFTLLAVWLWLEAWERSEWRWWAAYAVVCFLGLWIHMTIAFIMAAQGMIYLALAARRTGRGERWMPVLAWLLCGGLTLLAYSLALPEFFRTALGEASLPSEWINPAWLAMESLRNLRAGFAGAAVVAAGAVAAGAGWIDILRRNPQAGVLMVLPAALGAATMIVLAHNLWPRFFFFAMGFGLLAAVNGVVVLPRILRLPEKTAARTGTVLALLLIAASAATLPRCYALPKQDFTGARDWVERTRQAGEEVVAVGLAAKVYPYFAPGWAVPATDGAFEKLVREERAEWLVYTLPIQLRAWHPRIWAAVERDYEAARVFPGTLGDGAVYACRRKAQNSRKMVSDR